MNQQILFQAENNIRANKSRNQARFDMLMAGLYADEEFQKLYKQHAREMIENAKKEAYGVECDKTRERSLESKIFELKKKHMLETIHMRYDCMECRDSGYVDGKMCKCLKKEISRLLLAGSGFEKLENFEDSIKTSGALENVYKLMQCWCASNFDKNLIYLTGGTGVGKTHLMSCMANDLIQRGKVVRILSAYELNRAFKDFNRSDSDSFDGFLDCEVLFIDDLGTEPIYANLTVNCLYLIINERKMKNKPTIITSNLSPADLCERYGERIFSRIADKRTSIVLNFEGKDRRINRN